MKPCRRSCSCVMAQGTWIDVLQVLFHSITPTHENRALYQLISRFDLFAS